MDDEDLEAIRQAAEDLTKAQQRRDEVIIEAVRRYGRSQAEVANAAGVSRQRINQILHGGGPALSFRPALAPDPGDLKIYVVEKRESERGQPTVVRSTMTAVAKLKTLAEEFGTGAEYEAVPPPGMLDLNQPNLVVLMGPRTSALVAQAVSADPVIQWQRGTRREWFITDTVTGVQYHSDFDEGWEPRREGERRCVAHIGRIRRRRWAGQLPVLGWRALARNSRGRRLLRPRDRHHLGAGEALTVVGGRPDHRR